MTARTLYVASGNPGKLRDFSTAAATYGAEWVIAPLPRLADIPAPAEDSTTFGENACAKALYYARHRPGAIVLADDSGLSVDALGGDPGVYSARFADQAGYVGEASATQDARNNAWLLEVLRPFSKGLPRRASYRCVLAAARGGEIIATAEGSVAGEILTEPHGTNGFGYDPLFFLPQLNLSMAELGPEARLALSHRGEALRRILPQLASL